MITLIAGMTAAIFFATAIWAGEDAGNQRLERKIRINGRPLGPEEMTRLEEAESRYRFRLPDADLWYDTRSGAVGLWKGPTAGFMPAGLKLGSKMPANCSIGGTGVFVNDRELHPIDVMALRQFMTVLPGRWWVDAYGNGGLEGGPAMFNMVSLVQQARSRGSGNSAWSRRVDAGGGSMTAGGDGGFLYFMDSNGNTAYLDQ